ncbi:hypothetical protein BOTBODRAFT_350698 [Botryobasidium botryosum FD-172 SS1]|uniref:Uncharacterized protein n=1 Tax=Botryobasidium botryosum (strain FD-172 SS1) TaxID=930990 RepID=A0A067MFY5_BOTB1|nr:hypothetical protein BOTBODRAFT_350698 [Botryobasidium botryosum FD-172 SS1]
MRGIGEARRLGSASPEHYVSTTMGYGLPNIPRAKRLPSPPPVIHVSVRAIEVEFRLIRPYNPLPVFHCPTSMLLREAQPFTNMPSACRALRMVDMLGAFGSLRKSFLRAAAAVLERPVSTSRT